MFVWQNLRNHSPEPKYYYNKCTERLDGCSREVHVIYKPDSLTSVKYFIYEHYILNYDLRTMNIKSMSNPETMKK